MDFEVVFHALESVMTFVIIGCVGYYLGKRGWFDDSSTHLMSRLVTQVALPPYLLYNINTILTRDEIRDLAYGMVVPIVSIVVTLIVALIVARAAGVAPERRGIFCTTFSFTNTVYIGIPVNLALFGEASLPFVILYYASNSILFWTVGNYLLASDSEASRTRMFSLATARKFLSPPMIGFLIGLALLLLDVKLPPVLANTAKYLGNLTTPLVMISIGVTLQQMGFGNIKFSRDLALVLLSRLIIGPFIVIAAMWVFPVPDLMHKVFIIKASLPAMTTIAMLSNYYRTDVDFAAVTVTTTTLFSVVAIPAYMVLITHWF